MNEIDSHVRPSDVKQKPPISGKDFGETRTGGAPDNDSPRDQIKQDGKNQQIHDENPFVYVNNALKQIQQVKSTLLEGLGKPKEMERSLLQYFHEEFAKFSTAAQGMSQRLLEKNLDGAEDLFGNLFNENEFADLFVKHCDLYLAGRTTWSEFQKPFEPYLKKPQVAKNINGDASTIGEYVSIRMQPNMLASDLTGGKALGSKQYKTENQIDKNINDDHDDADQPEVTIKRNVDFTADNQVQKDFSKEQQDKLNIHENLPASQKPPFQPFSKLNEHNNIKPIGQESEKRTLRSAVSSSEVSKYKFQYKSRANFSRLTNSSSQSNLSVIDNNNATQPPISRFSAINNGNLSNQKGDQSIEELSSKLKDTLQLLNEIKEQRDSYKQRYNQAQVQLLELQSQLTSSNQLPK